MLRGEETVWPSILVMTSPALRPAVSAADPLITDRTSTPSFTPKELGKLRVQPFGFHAQNEYCARKTYHAAYRASSGGSGGNGILGMAKVKVRSCREPMIAVIDCRPPLRQICISAFASGGRLLNHSDELRRRPPRAARYTPESRPPVLMPALDAGESSETEVTSTPCGSFSPSALARSSVISTTPIPR